MLMKNYLDKAIPRIAHIEKHMQYENSIESKIFNIMHNTGNPAACILGLSSHALGQAMLAWFKNNDLNTCREWCYVSAKLDQVWYQQHETKINPGSRLLKLLKSLLSNNDVVI